MASTTTESTTEKTTGIASYEDYIKSQTVRENKTELGRTEFLQLLVATLRYQDPMEPVKDTDFVAQLASFNTLTQMESLNNTMTKYTSYGLIGKYAVAVFTDENNVTRATAGVVDRVFSLDNVLYAQIGEDIFEASKITDVFDVQPIDETSERLALMMENLLAYNMVGRYVTAEIANPAYELEVDNPEYSLDDELAALGKGETYDIPKTVKAGELDTTIPAALIVEGLVDAVWRDANGVITTQVTDLNGVVHTLPASSVLQVRNAPTPVATAPEPDDGGTDGEDAIDN
jgi:flagellar basal-body rod modification protein FlgD